MQNYLTLTVVISSGPDDKLRVRATSNEGQGNAKIAYIDMQDFAGMASGITRSSRAIGSISANASPSAGVAGQQKADELGTALFDALFQGSVRDVLRDTASAAQEQADQNGTDTGVRIRLIIDMEDQKTAEVASLPWELMREDKHRGSPIVLSSETTLVRSIDVSKSTIVRRLNGALRILLIKSNPAGTGPLNLDEESSELKLKIDDLQDVEVDEVRPERDAILKKLKEKKYHIVHYMGHGDYSPETGGILLMEDENGNSVKVSSEEFKVWMQHPSLRLVFLNACNTGTTSDELGLHPFAGVATSLIASGLPAVIAMQFPISDQAAIDFSETFYERLAQGLPVEAAVTEGRKKLLSESEWATPVLYLRAKDGNLFDRIEVEVPAETKTEETVENPTPAPVIDRENETKASWYKKPWIAAIGGAIGIIILIMLIPSEWAEEDAAQTAGNAETSQQDSSANQPVSASDIKLADDALDAVPDEDWTNDLENDPVYARVLDVAPFNAVKKFAEEGDNTPAYVIGAAYYVGFQTLKSPKNAEKWLKIAADHEVPLPAAQYWLAYFYESGESEFLDPDEALIAAREYYQKAAAGGNFAAQKRLNELNE